jgi:hypothetical protein
MVLYKLSFSWCYRNEGYFMEVILSRTGLMAVLLLIICLIKKLNDCFYEREIRSEVSNKVYQAARAFAEGESDETVRAILITCIDFDEDDIDEVLSRSCLHRGDRDGGYQGFFNAAMKVLTHY